MAGAAWAGCGGLRWYRVYRARIRAGLERCRRPGCPRPATTLDHIVPRGAGGRSAFDNAAPLCEPDNHEKGSGSPEWAAALVSLAQEEAAAPPGQRWSVLGQVVPTPPEVAREEQAKRKAAKRRGARRRAAREIADQTYAPLVGLALAVRAPGALRRWRDEADGDPSACAPVDAAVFYGT